MLLSDYLRQGIANLAVHTEVFPGAGVYDPGRPLPASAYAVNDEAEPGAFVWAWLYDDPHAFWVESLDDPDDDDQVTLTLVDERQRLQAVLIPPDAKDERAVRTYRRAIDYADLLASLRLQAQALAAQPRPIPEPPPLSLHRVLLLSRPVGETGWTTIGAMAAGTADAEEWILPAWQSVASFWTQATAARRQSDRITPAAFLDYWETAGGNGVNWRVAPVDPVLAPSPRHAAQVAALSAQ